jgi:hypothetical protein
VGFLVLAVTSGCTRHDPAQELEVRDIETYWAIDTPTGQTQKIAPVARFHVVNRSERAVDSVQAQATFKRKGDSQAWASGWGWVAVSKKPLQPKQQAQVTLESEGHYTIQGVPPESMLQNPGFQDAQVEIFLKISGSNWARMGGADVERRIGAKSVEGALR